MCQCVQGLTLDRVRQRYPDRLEERRHDVHGLRSNLAVDFQRNTRRGLDDQDTAHHSLVERKAVTLEIVFAKVFAVIRGDYDPARVIVIASLQLIDHPANLPIHEEDLGVVEGKFFRTSKIFGWLQELLPARFVGFVGIVRIEVVQEEEERVETRMIDEADGPVAHQIAGTSAQRIESRVVVVEPLIEAKDRLEPRSRGDGIG